MKRIIIAIAILLSFVCLDVKAEGLFVNRNGVELTDEQYNYISELYYDGYQNYITQNEVNELITYNLFNKPIKSNSRVYYEDTIGRATSHTASGRTITISKSCSTKCVVTVKAVWSGIPTIQSYDVIGMRFSNTSASTVGTGNVSSNNYNVSYNTSSSNYKASGNGYGYSVKLGNASGMVVITSATVNTGGTVYGAYEHATSSISLANSKSYNISSTGQGSVFAFIGAAVGKYDNVSGVQINT